MKLKFTKDGDVLQVGTTGGGEVIVNHPNLHTDAHGVGHIVFSPEQARNLARLLGKHADEAEGQPRARSPFSKPPQK